MELANLIARAKFGIGKNKNYESPGITPPLVANTYTASSSKIDCSGYMACFLRIARNVTHPKYIQINGGWFETTSIYADVASSWGLFEQLTEPKVGAFLVYTDHSGHDGRIGVVTGVNGGSGINGVDKVIHSSLGAWTHHHDSIQETPPAPWLHQANSLIGWYSDIT